MLALLVMIAAGQVAPSASGPLSIQSTLNRETIYLDESRGIRVQFGETPSGTVAFTAHLPAGWTFGIDVDGNQDSIWGLGIGMPDAKMETSEDRSFGQDAKNGVFCSQFVFTAFEKDPAEIYSKSECGGLKSSGRVTMSGFDSKMRATITYELPPEEIFGARQTARIQACVWDTVRWNCQHRLPNLLELRRTAGNTAQ